MGTSTNRRGSPATRTRPANDRSSGLFIDFVERGQAAQKAVDAEVCRLTRKGTAYLERRFPRDGRK